MSTCTCERALFAFDAAWVDRETDTFVYGVIDFTMPSDQHRFFVMDLARVELLFEEYVAHGSGSQDPSDERYANDFSNVHESHMSSLGMVKAAETYTGSYGYSVRLDGIDLRRCSASTWRTRYRRQPRSV